MPARVQTDLTFECTDFPAAPSPEILRTVWLDILDDNLNADVRLLIVDGAEGIGKTTLLSQFGRRHRHRTLSLFIRPSARPTVDIAYLSMEIARQAYMALKGEQLDHDVVPEGLLRTTLAALQRRARQERLPWFFIIDGLHELAEAEFFVRDVVLGEFAPFSYDWFRFVITGPTDGILPLIPAPPPHKSLILGRIDSSEIQEMLSDIPLEQAQLEVIEEVCRGNPSRVAQVRRILRSSANPSAVLSSLQDAAPDLFAYEWKAVNAASPALRLPLAVLAHDRRSYSIATLAVICQTEPGILVDLLKPISFVSVDGSTGAVSFVSQPHRRFAAEQLRSYEPIVNTRIIDHLLEPEQRQEAVLVLPAYYEQTSRDQELLAFMKGSHIVDVIERTKSLSAVRQRVQLGIRTARKLEQYSELVRFSMHNAVIQDITGVGIWGAEVAALAAIGDYAGAVAVAQNALLNEDALHLLAIVARTQREQGKCIDLTLLDQIRTLYGQIDPKNLGSRTVDIAADLVASVPELAIALVEEANASGKNPGRWI